MESREDNLLQSTSLPAIFHGQGWQGWTDPSILMQKGHFADFLFYPPKGRLWIFLPLICLWKGLYLSLFCSIRLEWGAGSVFWQKSLHLGWTFRFLWAEQCWHTSGVYEYFHWSLASCRDLRHPRSQFPVFSNTPSLPSLLTPILTW